MLRLIHTADWQIGKPYGKVADPRKRYLLQEERLRAIGRIAAVVRQRQARLVVVAGDLFDSPTVAPTAVLEVLEAIGAMEVPVVVIPGNHDHGAPGTVWHREEFQRERARRAPNLQPLLQREPWQNAELVVLPCPLLRQADSADPTAWIASLDWSSLPADRPRLVLAHGGIQGFAARDYDADGEARGGAHNQLDLARLPDQEIDYIALGDWHNLKAVSAKAWYPGTPEPDRFDQGDANQRGQVLQVELERGAPPVVEAIPTGRLGWHQRSVRFQSDDDLERLEVELQRLIGGRVSQDLLQLEVSGQLSLGAHQRYQALMAGLEDQLLRLKRKGHCDTAPRAEELAQLVERPGDPLIAGVAAQLQRRLDLHEKDGEEASARLTRLALSELFGFATRP